MSLTHKVGLFASLTCAFVLNLPEASARLGSEEPLQKPQDVFEQIESEDSYQRQLGFLRLEALRDPATLPRIEPYLKHEQAEYRAYSLRAIAAIQAGKAVPLLLERLANDPDPLVRQAALLGAEPFMEGSPEILTAAIGAMQDKDTQVRMVAVDIVSRSDKPDAQQAIRTRLKRESRPDVLRVLEAAIQRIDPTDE